MVKTYSELPSLKSDDPEVRRANREKWKAFVSSAPAVVASSSKDGGREVLYWVGKKMKFLNTHERKNNHGTAGHEASVTKIQFVPNNQIVIVKGEYKKDGASRKLSKIVGKIAEDQSKADEYIRQN